jgi:hypothetical protein
MATTNFVMVARSEAGGAAEVPGLELSTPQAKIVFARSTEMKKLRKERARTSLALTSPNTSEIDLIHSMHLDAKAAKRAKDKMMASGLENQPTPEEINAQPRPFKWTSHTKMSNTGQSDMAVFKPLLSICMLRDVVFCPLRSSLVPIRLWIWTSRLALHSPLLFV